MAADWRHEGRKTVVVLSGGNTEPTHLLHLDWRSISVLRFVGV